MLCERQAGLNDLEDNHAGDLRRRGPESGHFAKDISRR
jgi:hypothetical protein